MLGAVFFDFDRYDLGAEARERLDENARFLLERTELIVLIEGHCDERGTQEYNLALGDRRAQAARSYLIGLGLPGERLRTLTYGKERPFCRESSPACWSQNRRAHFVVVARTATG